MGRPKGMRKIDGIWYLPNGDIAPSSKAKFNGAAGSPQGTQTAMAPIVPEKPVHKATEVSESVIQEASNGTGRLEVQEVAVGTNVGGKVQGMHLYSMEEIKRVETQTGLMFVGEFAEQQGALIPVFLRADHDDETRRAKLASIRRGI